MIALSKSVCQECGLIQEPKVEEGYSFTDCSGVKQAAFEWRCKRCYEKHSWAFPMNRVHELQGVPDIGQEFQEEGENAE